MRVELALIVGIVCFCCWCAYILVKMNYPAAAVAPPPPPRPPPPPSSPPRLPTSGQHHLQYQPAAAMVAGQVLPAPQQHQHPYLYRQHNRSRWPVQVEWAPPVAVAARYREREARRDMTEPEEAETSSDGAGQEDENPPPPPQFDETTDDAQEDEPTEANSGEGDGEGDGLEQSRGGRHHSEQEWSSTERDRQGRPLIAKRRHLINGRPAEEHRVAAPSDVQLQRQQPDFDQVVNEIDSTGSGNEEDGAEEEPAQSVGQQLEEESRPMGTSVGATGLVVGSTKTGGGGGKRPRDSHEHRLSETLTAQQWDDDSGQATPSTEQDGRDKRQKLRVADDEVESGGGEGQDLAELELFANSDRFPFGSSRRRRRWAKEEDDLSTAPDLALEVINSSAPALVSGETPGDHYGASYTPPVVMSNGHSGGQVINSGDWPLTPTFPYYSAGSYSQPFTVSNGHRSRKKHRPRRRKFKKSALAQGKRREAEAHWIRKSSKHKKGGRKKRRRGAKKKMSKKSKEFKTETSGRKSKGGGGKHGAKKGALYLNDKGYKKRGFKKHYRRLEAGDHKTYFDEFRDKDHNKRWKEYRDKQDYGQSKKWRAKEAQKYKNYKSKEASDKKTSQSGYKAKAGTKAHASKAKRAKGYSNKSHKFSD